MKRIYRGPLLWRDVAKATKYYELESATLSLNFLVAYGNAFRLLRQYPSIGSPRYAQMAGLSDLRCLPTSAFPYLLFYRDQPGRLILSRLLHMSRDLPSLLASRNPPTGKDVRRPRNPL